MSQTVTDSRRAVLLLGHGSKLDEANETLRKVAATLQARGAYACVQPAFLQMESPDFQEGVSMMVEKGHTDITVMPYFLYMGLHVQKDLPDEVEKALKSHPGLEVNITPNIGFHEKLIDIVVERIGSNGNGSGKAERSVPFEQHPIEAESFRIIDEELDSSGIPDQHLPILKRVIHSTADFGFRETLKFSPGAVEAGIRAIIEGGNIVTDVKMVASGIARGRLRGSEVLTFSSDEDVKKAAEENGTTRTAASMRKAAGCLDGGIAAIGNAPTALIELLKLIREGKASPALVVGVPVGFVGAAEAKAELAASGCEYITTEGRKGGSTVAVAIVNALAIMASERRSAGASL